MIKVCKELLPKEKFVLALSGGVDSLAIAHFLKQSKKNFLAVHNNAKYIAEDDHYERMVVNFCADFDIPLVTKTNTIKVKKSKGAEADCREQRYDVLLNVCSEHNIKKIVVCHHLDDCVESYLMNCLNGNSDFIPIPFVTRYPTAFVTRPFMLTEKSSLLQYVINKGIESYVAEDILNTDLKLKRNWIRHVLLPTIETKYPGLKKVVKKKMQQQLEKFCKPPYI
jgi:tRNA(Ile)-lysidine synthase